MQNKLLSFICGCVAPFSGMAFATERIQSFDSLIQVNTDGTIDVTETIAAYHEGDYIRRGIYRDLPMTKGLRYELIGVNRNGEHEPSFVEKTDGYYRINTGDDSLLESPGMSTFEIKYRVWNLPRSYDGYDEVYWNVTGDRWSLPIYNVSAKVELPYGAEILQQASYIGEYGDKESVEYAGNGQYYYYDGHLEPGEQMTIAVGFTPGVVATYKPQSENVESSTNTKHTSLVSTAIIGIAVANAYMTNHPILKTLLPVTLYFVYLTILIAIWYKKGRDPKARAIMPQYLPPHDLTAAQAACLYHKKKPNDVAAISLLQMIVNGYLHMTTHTEKVLRIFANTTYTLTRTGRGPSNPEEECFTKKKIILDGYYDSGVENIVNNIKSQVQVSMKEYYTDHKSAIAIPTIIYLALTCITWWPIFSPLFLMIFGIATVVALAQTLGKFVVLLLGTFIIVASISPLLTMNAPAAPDFLSGENLFKIGFVFFVIIMYAIFAHLMYQPTEKGQRLTEYLAGLKMFLGATKTPIKTKTKENLTENNMEKIFPYAVALGLEKAWAKKFAKVFGMKNYDKFVKEHSYTSDGFRSSFTSGLASGAKEPSSRSDSDSRDSISSGSGGHGFAGGGGGGGGGGGR